MIDRLSVEDRAILLSLLRENDFNEVKGIIEDFERTREIIDFKRSQPIGIVQFVEQTTILRTLGYHLIDDMSSSNEKCPCCRNKSCVTLIYASLNSVTDTHDFDLCLYCFHAVKMTPIYAYAEGKV